MTNVKKKKITVCLCSCLWHPVGNANAPYYIVCGASESTLFFPVNGTIFGGKMY